MPQHVVKDDKKEQEKEIKKEREDRAENIDLSPVAAVRSTGVGVELAWHSAAQQSTYFFWWLLPLFSHEGTEKERKNNSRKSH